MTNNRTMTSWRRRCTGFVGTSTAVLLHLRNAGTASVARHGCVKCGVLPRVGIHSSTESYHQSRQVIGVSHVRNAGTVSVAERGCVKGGVLPRHDKEVTTICLISCMAALAMLCVRYGPSRRPAAPPQRRPLMCPPSRGHGVHSMLTWTSRVPHGDRYESCMRCRSKVTSAASCKYYTLQVPRTATGSTIDQNSAKINVHWGNLRSSRQGGHYHLPHDLNGCTRDET